MLENIEGTVIPNADLTPSKVKLGKSTSLDGE